jgi:hypothetical protein
MCPCNPNDVSFPIPSGPSGPAIPGFGSPFAIPTPKIPFPAGFPEDILDIMNKLQMLIPPGALKPQLNPNFGKDIYDGIMKLLDQFMPFLMLYKFFLPILNLIICIIEVLCALMNPFALISALNRLFTQCIPEFLNLFPIFALILMIISLLLLLLALILYLINQILKFIKALLRNILALKKALQGNANGVLAIAKKLGALLCIFQNLFVLLALFTIIIQVIKDILSLIFSIPPCQGGGPGSTDGCCAATYCPTIVQGPYTNTTGTFQYLPEAGFQTTVALGLNFLTSDLRTESWQLFDNNQTQAQQFRNVFDAFDVSPTVQPKPVYFPTDANYTATTSAQQSAYTVDLRMFYNPSQWNNRPGTPRFVRFKNCIVLSAPTTNLKDAQNNQQFHFNGVLNIAGGLGYEDDGTTKLTGFAIDGITPITGQATLNNFFHMPGQFSLSPVLSPNDGYTFQNMTYTWTPNTAVLLQKNLINIKCTPQFALNSAYVNDTLFGNIGIQTLELKEIVFGTSGKLGGRKFADPAAAQQCLQTALANLQTNMTVEGVAEFQAATSICLDEHEKDVKASIIAVVTTGFNPCKSNFTLSPSTQFTTVPITVTVNLNENNGLPLTNGIPLDTGTVLAQNIKAIPTFGTVTPFVFDGYQAFTAQLNSTQPGNGQIMITFQDQTLCTDSLPTSTSPPNVSPPNGTTTPVHSLQTLNYTFVYAPFVGGNIPLTGEGDTTGTQPRRGPDDVSKDND